MWLNPKPNLALLCVSTNNQMIQSNVGPPILRIFVGEMRRWNHLEKHVEKEPHELCKIERVRK